ncbi:homocitrate synthase/isopropylmalate synthase family protein [Methanosphaerula subterraneus]|uniref:homocitrate synthase/isopropylmalate synthase family protein n=1 Tax=Methanosphaerula subterraneus TaxID=3350244 RepID=UPI003F847104
MCPEQWNVEICDVTLRDGEQTPGVSFTCDEKMKIAGMLDQVGVDVIEAGFPTVSPEEKRCVTAISRMDLDARICCLARARPEDVEAAAAAEVDMVSLFIATSDLHIRHKYRKPREVVLAGALDMIDLARDHDLAVRFAAEDASRTDPAFLKEMYRAGGERGAALVSFADTVGCLTPLEMYSVMSDLCSSVSVPLCAHCHNDMGCATANTITAAAAGAFQLHTTVNGIGERAGNASLEEVLVLLNLKGGVVRYDLSHLGELSAQVSTSSGLPVPRNKPVVGDLVFSHESGIHIAAMLEDPATYEYLPPALVGRGRQFILGKHTGTKALRYVTASLGHQLTDPQIGQVLALIKERSEHKCSITPEVLKDLILQVEEGRC